MLQLLSTRFLLSAPTEANKTQAYQHVMGGHAEQCGERYLELAKKKVDSVEQGSAPCIDDHDLSPEEMVTKRELSPEAIRIVLKVVYLVGVGRMALI